MVFNTAFFFCSSSHPDSSYTRQYASTKFNVMYTVEPPITNSLRYGPPPYNVTDKQRAPDRFCHRNNKFSTSERRTTSYLWTTDRTCAPKGQVAVQNSLQERTDSDEASGRKCEISITISNDSYSAAPRKYIRSLVPSIIVHLVCPH